MTDECVKCSSCKCKYNNNDDDIRDNFGYDRLNKRYKCCVKCRNRNTTFFKELHEREKLEGTWMEQFYKIYKFPNYEEVSNINNNNTIVYNDYNEFNHNLLNKLWDNILDDDKVKLVGRIINNFGNYLDLKCMCDIFTLTLLDVLNKNDICEDKRKGIAVNSSLRIKRLWGIP